MTPQLSVVLPARNAEGTIARAIESCLHQGFAGFELLVVLNGCSDGTARIVQELAVTDPRVKVLESSLTGGVAEAMELGVESADAAIVARMDADDVSLPGRFEAQWGMLQNNPEIDVVSCRVELRDALGEGMRRYVDWVNGLDSPEAVARERFVECPVIQPSLMMRKEAIEAAGGYRIQSWAEDHDLFLRMLERGVRFGKVPESLFQWQDHAQRLTRTHEAYAEEQVWRMKAHYLARLPMVTARGVALCGAGPIGKRLGRLLLAEGIRLHGYFEVNPRRVGETINEVPVAGPGEFGGRWREAVLLSAVGVAGGRGRVRGLAQSAGYEEGRDFFAVC